MGLFTTTPVSLVDPTQQSAGTVNAKADQFVSSAKGTDFAQHFELVGSATKSLQQQVNSVMQALRGDLPLPQDLGLTDPTGRVIAKFGFTADGAAQIYGLTVFDPLNDVAAFVGVQTELPLAITATTNASPDVITVTGHGYSNGDTVLIQGATGDTAINGIRIVENITANTFTTTDLLGNPINGNGAYAGGGTATRYFGGGYFQTVGIGGTGPSTAKIRASADGNVTIIGARIELDGSQAKIILDPVLGEIDVIGVATNQSVKIGSTGVIAFSQVNGSATFVTNSGISVANTGGVAQTFATSTGFNTLGVYQINGTTVIDSSRNITGVDISFLSNLKLGSVVVIDPFANANLFSLKLSGVTVIDSSRNAAFVSLTINGTSVIDSSQNATFTSLRIGSGNPNVQIISSVIVVNDGSGTTQAQIATGGFSTGPSAVYKINGTTVIDASRNGIFAGISGTSAGIPWSLGTALVINGFTGMTSAGQLFSSNGFTGSQSFLTSLTPTSKTISVVAGIVTNIV